MFKPLDPLLHSELRLAVMSLLVGVESADFVYLRQQTGATAGNLSVQIDKLSKAGYIAVEKSFRGKMPRTVCRITETGREAFAPTSRRCGATSRRAEVRPARYDGRDPLQGPSRLFIASRRASPATGR